MAEKFQTGANHVLEAIHRVLQAKKDKNGKLPPILFIQADSCTRENKNKYFMGFCEMLVALGVFVITKVSFLPIGHTPGDIDQNFSCIATRLRMNDSVTMEDLIDELNCVEKPGATAKNMDKVASFSGLCDETGCLRTVKGISQYRFFRFSRTQQQPENHECIAQYFSTTCDVKLQLHDEWEPLEKSSKRLGLLKSLPELSDSQNTDTTPPENVLEVNKHLELVEERIGCKNKTEILLELRDKVYTRRFDPFHWDLESSFELKGDHKRLKYVDAIEVEAQAATGDHTSPEDLSYPLNSFLAVKTERGCDEQFWTARVFKIAKRKAEGGKAFENIS